MLWSLGTAGLRRLGVRNGREWLVPDGRGGYAMGTVSGLRTRRYHGLLMVQRRRTGAGRMLGLASLDPVLTLPGGARVRLATHEWASGTVDPDGYELLERFELRDGLPVWRWRVGDVVLERTLAMRHGSPASRSRTRCSPAARSSSTLEALCTWRDAHGERHARPGCGSTRPPTGSVVEDAYRVAGPGFDQAATGTLGAHHREEAERGLAADEDL